MYTAEEIRNITFQRSVNGYKPGDVEEFLEELASQFESMQASSAAAPKTAEPAKSAAPIMSDTAAAARKMGLSEEGLKNLLISAQRTADSIVEEARKKAAEIVEDAEGKAKIVDIQCKTRLDETKQRCDQMVEDADRRSNELIAAAVSKSESVDAATGDSVARQQALFDKLKINVSDFKKDLVTLYKSQLELISKIPDEVPSDPDAIARAVELAVEKQPAPEDYIVKNEPENSAASQMVLNEKPSENADEKAEEFDVFPSAAQTAEPEKAAEPEKIETPKKQNLFDDFDDDDDDEDDTPFSLFKKRKKK